MMRKSTLILLLTLLISAPALGTVTITCSDEGGLVARIDYAVAGEPEKVRAFALDVSVDSGATIESVYDFQPGDGGWYGIFPGTIDLTDPNNPIWGTPIAPNTHPGAEGTGIGTDRVILEMGSLYEPNLAGPNDASTLCRLTVSADCNVTIVAEPIRGSVVLENGDTVGIVYNGCYIPPPYPPCWNCPTQCHGDADCDGDVNTSDWPMFRDSFGKCYPDQDYNPCADCNRDGCVNTEDWPCFRDNFGMSPPADCPPGGTWPLI